MRLNKKWSDQRKVTQDRQKKKREAMITKETAKTSEMPKFVRAKELTA